MMSDPKPASTPIRRINIRGDMLEVADLIELCFLDQMELDGREYLRQIRRAASDNSLLRWVPGSSESISVPLDGYVWEEDGRVVGNLTLIPFFSKGHWLYLICNVAVHPDYRRRGIGRELTQRALEHIQAHGASSAWLQVRHDNSAAVRLYHSLGFEERLKRATWSSEPIWSPNAEVLKDTEVRRRRNSDWELQSSWFEEIYPPEMRWNLAFEPQRYSTGLWSSLLRSLEGVDTQFWSVSRKHELMGGAILEIGRRSMEQLWVAADPYDEEDALYALLFAAHKANPEPPILMINYPAGRAENAFKKAGFELRNILIWMELSYKK